ncbi:MAG TPA: HIT domain-containing protein [Fimbriimonadaceae bacterium]|nr:HIT domain-containing protein [Fimbriimonadaceae bacterium]
MAERLWAPWRLSYIEKASKAEKSGGATGCIFVDLPAQENDRENLLLFRGETAFVMLNAFPYTNGHLMVAPYRHTNEMGELSDEELLEINKLVARCLSWIRKAYGPDGFNIGVNLGRVAGAGIPTHIHWHIVPRWEGDTNFMGVVGEVRVLPQSLEESYDRLKAVVDAETSPAG